MAEAPLGGGPGRRVAIVFPVCNEEESLPRVLRAFRNRFDPDSAVLVAGINGSTDRSAVVAREAGALVAETALRGYGRGCLAALDLALRLDPRPWAVAFAAADGASDPEDVARVIARLDKGFDLVMGERVSRPANRPAIGRDRHVGNRVLAMWAGLVSGHRFRDLGPIRAVRTEWIPRLCLREPHLGWTIAMQVRAARLGARIDEIPVAEHRRLAGVQKVSRGGAFQRLGVGLAIAWSGLVAGLGPRTDGSRSSLRS